MKKIVRLTESDLMKLVKRVIVESKELRDDSNLDIESLKNNDDIVFLKHEDMRDTSMYYDIPLNRYRQEVVDIFYIDSVEKDDENSIKLKGHVLAKIIDGKLVPWRKLKLGPKRGGNLPYDSWDEYDEDSKSRYTYKEVFAFGRNGTLYSVGSSVDYYELDDDDLEKILNKYMEIFPTKNIGFDITDDFRGMGSMSESRRYKR